MNKPLVYIIILNWNGYKDTLECLFSLKKITYKNFQVVLVDNASNNNEANKLKSKFPQITVIKNKTNLGYSRANNQGIRLALKSGAKYVLLLNNDTVIKKNFLEVLVEFAEKNNYCGMLTPKILYHNTNIIWAMGGKMSVLTSIPRMIGQGKVSSDFRKIIEPDFATGCALFVSTDSIKKTGALNPKYFAYYEDMDWSYRIRKKGFDIKVIPKSIVWHKVSQSTKQRFGKVGETMAYLMARNGLVFGHKNLMGINKIYYMFAQIFIKMPLYLLLKVNDKKSALSYVDGVIQGIKIVTRNSYADSHLKKYV